jgi:uncharacterized protein (TIGR00645 family)
MRPILTKFILVNRWLAAAFLLGLTFALLLFAIRFMTKVASFAAGIFRSPDDQALLDLLHLLDWTLAASLVVMVVLASWDSLVSAFDPAARKGGMSWIRTLDPSNLKVKLAGSIAAISAVQLLQMFMRIDSYSDRAIGWAMALHGVFLVGAIALALTDRISGGSRTEADPKVEN